MIGPKETASFVSPLPSMFSSASPWVTLNVERKQNLLFSLGPVKVVNGKFVQLQALLTNQNILSPSQLLCTIYMYKYLLSKSSSTSTVSILHVILVVISDSC